MVIYCIIEMQRQNEMNLIKACVFPFLQRFPDCHVKLHVCDFYRRVADPISLLNGRTACLLSLACSSVAVEPLIRFSRNFLLGI